MTSSEAILQMLNGDTRKAWSGMEITKAALPLTTKMGGKDPEHSLYMNLHKEAKRADGLVVKVKKDGKTLFRLNPKRRALRSENPAKAEAPAKATTKKAPAK